jgi:acyl carrier protein
MEELLEKLKLQLIEALNLEEIKPEDIDPDAPLFGDEGLGLDSIDALEIILLLDKEYGIKLKNPAEGKHVFKSVRTIAECIESGKAGKTE